MMQAPCVTEEVWGTGDTAGWHEDIAPTPRAVPHSSRGSRAGRPSPRRGGVREAGGTVTPRERVREGWPTEAFLYGLAGRKASLQCCQQEKALLSPSSASRPQTLVSESFLAMRFDEMQTA